MPRATRRKSLPAFWRDTARYPAGGPLFWSAYLKPGIAPGSGNGYWLNFGAGWSHLHNDDPAQMLTGAARDCSLM